MKLNTSPNNQSMDVDALKSTPQYSNVSIHNVVMGLVGRSGCFYVTCGVQIMYITGKKCCKGCQ